MRIFRKAFRELFPQATKAFHNSTDYWQKRYYYGGNSGKGSYGEEALFKANFLNDLINDLNIDGVIELGCGDGNNANLYTPKFYFGFDISHDAIIDCRKMFKQKPNFFCYEITASFPEEISVLKTHFKLNNPLVISFDVIFHLVEDKAYEDYLNKLEFCADHFILVYATDFDKEGTQPHVRHRYYSDDLEKRGFKESLQHTEIFNDKAMKLFKKVVKN